MGNLVRHDRSFNAETANQAVFVDATLRLSEQFAISAGVRSTQDDKSWWGFRTDRPTGEEGRIFSAEHDWSDTVGRLVLEYFPRDDMMLYASYSEGYKSGFIADQIVPTAGVPNGGVFPFNHENVETVELGLRSEWWDNRLRFNLTLFDTAYTDMQVDALVQVPDGMGNFEPVRFITNAGDVDFDGWEMDLLLAATENLRFDVSIGKLNHTIVRLDPSVAFKTDGAMPRAPENSWKVGVRYDVPVGNGGNIRFGLDHGFTDTQFSTFGNTNATWMPEYELTNARVAYTEPNGRWTAALFCTNCSDEWYLRGQHDNQNQWGGADSILGKPLMYGVEFSMDF
jgi:iron complex outermembrane receptor protein